MKKAPPKPYNVKIIQYPTGELQVKKYSRTLCERKPKKDRVKLPPTVQPTVFLEGFGECTVYTPEEWATHEKKQAYNLYQSMQNTKKAVYQIARSVKWEYMLTFTFDKDKIPYDRTDYKKTAKQVCQFLRNQRRTNPDIKFLVIGEPHKKIEENGLHAWHFHALVSDCPNLILSDSGRVSIGKKSYSKKRGVNGKTIYNVAGFKYGWTTATKIDDTVAASKYVLKYVTKTFVTSLRGKGVHRYYVSKNIPKPTVTTANIKQSYMDDYIDQVLQSHNKEITNTYTSSHYVDTTFYETRNKQ